MKIEYLKFKSPYNNIEAFSTKRSEIKVSDPYSGFNICSYTGDETSHIEECSSKLCDSFGIEADNLIIPRQTHSSNILIIDSSFINSDKTRRSELLYNIDALVSPLENVIIGINTADCVPILFYDYRSGIIAAAHAGWKGTIDKIASKTLSAIRSLGGNIKTTQVIIGPSICSNCFEVGEEVTDRFREAGFPINNISHRNQDTGKTHIDLCKANKWLLTNENIPSDNINISGVCTKCNSTEYFSARASGINSGRIFTGILRKYNPIQD